LQSQDVIPCFGGKYMLTKLEVVLIMPLAVLAIYISCTLVLARFGRVDWFLTLIGLSHVIALQLVMSRLRKEYPLSLKLYRCQVALLVPLLGPLLVLWALRRRDPDWVKHRHSNTDPGFSAHSKGET
jgi:hypothetical protein